MTGNQWFGYTMFGIFLVSIGAMILLAMSDDFWGDPLDGEGDEDTHQRWR